MPEFEGSRRSGVLPVLVFALLTGCAGPHPRRVSDFQNFLIARGRVPAGALVATFFEVGLGDAILLEFPSGKCLLVDAGVGWNTCSILNYLKARGITQLDGLLLTHPHRDHYGGMKEIIEAVPVHKFFYNGVDTGGGPYTELVEALKSKGIDRTVLRRGDDLSGIFGPGVRIEVLYPDEKGLTLRSDPNAGSIVLRIKHGSITFLLTGDAENTEEARLIELEGEKLHAEVLKLGHHGSMGSGSTAFLKAVNPEIAVVQGTRWIDIHPFYPRPSYHIRRTLVSMGVPLLNTKHVGAVQVISDGGSIRWVTMRDLHAAVQSRRKDLQPAGR